MKKANPSKCDRAKKFWVGYLKNMTPKKYCKDYCTYNKNGLCGIKQR
jgi:hypothetical protein